MDQAETDILDWLSSGAKRRYEFDDDQIDPLDAMGARGEVGAITEGDGTVSFAVARKDNIVLYLVTSTARLTAIAEAAWKDLRHLKPNPKSCVSMSPAVRLNYH